jgi:DNA-binding response OmpR family regulator
VDDEPIACLTINYALQKARLKTKMVGNPAEGLKIAEESHFDLVILDVNMPTMNGFELCTKLRTMPAYKKTPVIFVTCMTDLESRAKSALSGGNEFIGKPFLLIELTVKALTYILRNQR